MSKASRFCLEKKHKSKMSMKLNNLYSLHKYSVHMLNWTTTHEFYTIFPCVKVTTTVIVQAKFIMDTPRLDNYHQSF